MLLTLTCSKPIDKTEYPNCLISNFAVNSMRVSTELYYVDVRNEFALDALHTLTARCGCSPFRYRC